MAKEEANEERKKYETEVTAEEVKNVERNSQEEQAIPIQNGTSMENRNEAKEQNYGGGKEVSVGQSITEAQAQEVGVNSVTCVPEIIVSSPKEEPRDDTDYYIAHIGKTVDGQEDVKGEGEASVQDTNFSWGVEDNKEKVVMEEASHEQELSGIQDDTKRGIIKEKVEASVNVEQEDSATKTGGENQLQTQAKPDEVDTGREDLGKSIAASFSGKISELPPLDMSQISQVDKGPTSPQSEEGGVDSPTYLNYVQDDDVCLETLRTAATVPGKGSPGTVTPLDTISEQDESEDEEKSRKTSLPSMFQCKFSTGMDNLSSLGEDEDAAEKEKVPAENEAKKIEDKEIPKQNQNKPEKDKISSKKRNEGKNVPKYDDKKAKKGNLISEESATNDTEYKEEEGETKTTGKEVTSKVQNKTKSKVEEEMLEKSGSTDETGSKLKKENDKKQTITSAATNIPPSEAEQGETAEVEGSAAVEAAAAATKTTVKRRRKRKKGKIKKDKESPVFLNEGARTFSNPISYLGGPNIEYDEEVEGEGEDGAEEERKSQNRDSIASIVSLD